jgi:predicted ATPase
MDQQAEQPNTRPRGAAAARAWRMNATSSLDPLIRSVRLRRDEIPDPQAWPWSLAAVRALDDLRLDPGVTFIVGQNGSGKSTLVEGIAVAAGFNPEGGTTNFNFATREGSVSSLADLLTLVRGARRPRTGFFLRAESMFNVATEIEHRGAEEWYGGVSLHEVSHGEGFLAIATNRFGPEGLYVRDEPEAGLSPRSCLALLARMHDLVGEGSQFVVATHSPMLLAYPGALIYELDEDGIAPIAFEDADAVRLTRDFLDAPDRYFRHLL